MDLLLDIEIILDLCIPRFPWYSEARLAIDHCVRHGGRIWIYAGSLQSIVYGLCNDERTNRPDLPAKVGLKLASQKLKDFAKDKHWLATLTEECFVFDSDDIEKAQLIKAMERFPAKSIKLLARDQPVMSQDLDLIITPKMFLELDLPKKSVEFIDLKAQQDMIRPTMEKNIHRVLHHGQYIMGQEILQLEERLANYVGAKHCISVSDGTKALLVAMMALGIKSGDEVITTPFTFIATGEMIALLGATPVFVDINPRTFNLDPEKIEAAITSKTKAIMPVSLFGQCADFDAINYIASNYDLPVIEDGAQSFGATYKGKKSCDLSTIGSTSFFPSKPLGCYGDGGALFTNDDALAKKMREIRLHGQDRRYHHPIIGINGRMDTLQAAIILAKLTEFEKEVALRAEIGARYSVLINDHSGLIQEGDGGKLDPDGSRLITPFIEPHNTCVYAQYTIRVQNRELVQKALSEAKIPSAVHYPIPLNMQPAFTGSTPTRVKFPHSEAAAKQVMSLPMGPYLTIEDQNFIVNTLLKTVDQLAGHTVK